MLPSSRRIPRKLYAIKGVFFHSKFITLKLTKTNSPQVTRCSVSVSKKIDKSAVVRNKIRRRVYSILETELNLLKPNLLLFLQAKKGIETSSFVDLKDDVVGLLQKAKVVSF